jgi:hypothetical protein
MQNVVISKNLPVKGLCGKSLSAWGPEPHPPPPVYPVYLFTQGRWEVGVEPERMLEGQELKKMCRKYKHDWLYLQSVNSDKHLLPSPFTG